MSKKVKPAAREGDLEHPYVQGDPIPAPEAVERSSDTTWAAWNELHDRHEARFADTEPASMTMRLPEQQRPFAPTEPAPLLQGKAATGVGGESDAAAPRRRAATYEQVMAVARKRNRVCPKPEHWAPIYELLPNRKKTARGPEPTPPLSGGAWRDTPSLSKRMTFREHIEWAATHDALDPFLAALEQLQESDWHHMGE